MPQHIFDIALAAHFANPHQYTGKTAKPVEPKPPAEPVVTVVEGAVHVENACDFEIVEVIE
jgi:hypothetical protein